MPIPIRQLDVALRGGEPRPLMPLMVFGLLAELGYGAVMGSFGLRPTQMLFSAAKVPILTGVAFALVLPSFFVLNMLLGLRDDFFRTLRAFCYARLAMNAVLAAAAPLTLFWYCSSGDYDHAILFNGGVFAASTVAAQVVLRRLYRPLVAVNPRHRWMLIAHLVCFTFVGIQMAWVLRPFIGNPASPTRFFRDGAWSNGYVEVAHFISSAISSSSAGGFHTHPAR